MHIEAQLLAVIDKGVQEVVRDIPEIGKKDWDKIVVIENQLRISVF